MHSFLERENRKLKELYNPWMEAYWQKSITGDEEWRKKEEEAETAYRRLLADPERFRTIQELRARANPGSLEHRQLVRLELEATENRIPDDLLQRIVRLSSQLTSAFSTFRGELDGRRVTENDLREILKTSRDPELCRKAWIAGKQVGAEVADGLLELVKLRNEAARRLGYEDYHHMSFALSELDRDEIWDLFDRLKELTDEPYRRVKREIDRERAEWFGIRPEDLRPWHYPDPFFQEAPEVKGADVTPHLRGKDIVELTVKTFDSVGMDIRDILGRSDLFEREGKDQHAFCLDLDRSGDVRILCNVREDQYWMETMLHEIGHAVYDKYIDPELPFILHTPAHIFVTEAVAMFFGRMVKRREWLKTFLFLEDRLLDEMAPALEATERRRMLIFARWVITFVRFERELYANPDQDLNHLWWKLVRDIQLVQPPDGTDEPHWASKIHFTVAPVYYHNYLLGELTASQFESAIRDRTGGKVFTPETGRFFREHIFAPGDRWGWSVLIERATGETLNPEHFVRQFVK
ncbi:M2 family metallopeptidase [Staphylospora marina]|uniref:M2 family metallopeptidase n=1 Tax=Staphylospora marina TaxID=2490858 RepID=UPI000F5B9386|nr:M2 family metallopeptidase [Staphylospora marina]